jgi:hypothetical protein
MKDEYRKSVLLTAAGSNHAYIISLTPFRTSTIKNALFSSIDDSILIGLVFSIKYIAVERRNY